jgi:hypothetical protein
MWNNGRMIALDHCGLVVGAGARTCQLIATANMARRRQPVTERILALLPGTRLLWIAAWALVAALNARNLLLETGARSAVRRAGANQTRHLV